MDWPSYDELATLSALRGHLRATCRQAPGNLRAAPGNLRATLHKGACERFPAMPTLFERRSAFEEHQLGTRCNLRCQAANPPGSPPIDAVHTLGVACVALDRSSMLAGSKLPGNMMRAAPCTDRARPDGSSDDGAGDRNAVPVFPLGGFLGVCRFFFGGVCRCKSELKSVQAQAAPPATGSKMI
jgi:hypothetical protein